MNATSVPGASDVGMDTALPLAGVKVLELGSLIAGPYAYRKVIHPLSVQAFLLEETLASM